MKDNFNPSKMYRKLYQWVFVSLLSLMVLTSCSQDEMTEDTIPTPASSTEGMKTMGNLTLKKNVIILNDESVSAISTMDNQSIAFNRSTNQTDSIEVGTVLVGTKINGDEVTNILSKVTSVSKANNQFIYQTTTAKLEEFIYSGTLSGVYDPSGKAPININGKLANYVPVEGFVSQELTNRITTIEAKNLSNQKLINFGHFTFDKTIPVLNQQLGPVGIGSNVNLKGGYTPKIDYTISFSWGFLTDFKVNFIMDDITLEALANIQGSLGYTVSTTDFVNIPFIPVVLGPTGLIISPTISAGPFLGVAATGKAQVKFLEVKGKANVLVAKNPQLNIEFQKTIEFNVTNLEGNLSAEMGIEMKGAVGLQFITASLASSGVRGRASIVPSIGVQAIPERKGILNLKGRLQADLFYAFGISPFKYEGTFPLLQKEIPIYNKDFYF
ncbi:hypothetical protein [Chryseobacterium sp.]|mgnify:CR=1 FL=1|uniref:hypothetical protein n=1 Tax=Chryseobacterium sp. TaxID=1871047 RepID=UPI0025C64F70|nr:hypothetical protein [Chryseobacterium sp.]